MVVNIRQLSLVVIATACFGGTAAAQEVGGSLGSSAGVFRAKNPKPATSADGKLKARRIAVKSAKTQIATKNTRRDAGQKPSSAKVIEVKARNNNNAELTEQFEALIVEGNEARDARSFINAELAYKSAHELDLNDARAIYGLGNIYADQQRWDDAENAYREALKINPLQSDANIALAYVLLQPNRSGNIAGRFSDAEFAAKRAIRIDPDNPMAHDQLGVSLELRGLIGVETESAYRRAIELDPNFALAHAHLARLLRKAGKVDESTAAYNKAVELAQDVPTMIVVAEVLQSANKFLESENLLRKASQMDEANPIVLFLLGRALSMRSNYSEAENALVRSIRNSPRTFAVYAQLGGVYLHQEKYQDAERTLMTALPFANEIERQQIAGTFGFTGVGDGYMKTGDSAAALRVYRQAKELDPSNLLLNEKIAAAESSDNK